MFIIIMSRLDLKLGHVGSKTRSLGHNLEKPCVLSREHSFDSYVMKVYLNIYDHNIYVKFETGSWWIKNSVARSNRRKRLCTFQ